MPEILFNDFSGGLWLPGEGAPTTEQHGFAVPSNALLKADNLEYDPAGFVRGRRGRVRYNAVALPGEVRALFRHYPRLGSNSEGPNFPAGPNIDFQLFGYPGTVAWTLPANVALEDDTPATAALTNQITHWIAAQGWTFTIPPTATILGIQLEIKRRAKATADTGDIADYDVRVGRTGSIQVTPNRAEHQFLWPRYLATDSVPRPFEWFIYGGPSDLWGKTDWLPAHFAPGGLFVFVSAAGLGPTITAEIDAVRVTVFYTDPAVTPKFIASAVSGANLIHHVGTAGVFAAIAGGTVPLPTARPRFVTWPEKNKTFIFDGLNPVKSYNGTIIQTVPTGFSLVAPHRGPYATLWKDRLFAAEPAESNFSIYACSLFDETDWPPELQLSVNDPQGGSVVGIVGFGDRLIILKNTSLWSFVGDIEFGGELVRYSDVGCVAPDTVQLTPYGIVFLGRDGLYLTDGQSAIPVELSRPLRTLFVDRLTQNVYPLAVGGFHPRKDQFHLKLDPAAGLEAYVLHRVAVPTQSGISYAFAWSHNPSWPFSASVAFDGESDLGEFYLGDILGVVWEADSGTQDDGVAIPIDVRTLQRLIDRQSRRGRAYHVKPLMRSNSAALFALRYDQSLVDNLSFFLGVVAAPAEYQEPRYTVTDYTQFGRFVSVGFLHPTGGPAIELHSVRLDIKLRSPRRWP